MIPTRSTLCWLLDGDPAIRWQTLRDLAGGIGTLRRAGAEPGRSRRLGRSPARQTGPRGHVGGRAAHPTAGSTHQSGRPRRTRCCCFATSAWRPTIGTRARRARSSSTAVFSGTAASTTDGVGGARRASRGWCYPYWRISSTDDERRDTIARHLLKEQLPDGGWNCRRDLGATHSLVEHHDQRARRLAPSRTAGRRRHCVLCAPRNAAAASSCSSIACSGPTGPGTSSRATSCGSSFRRAGTMTFSARSTTSRRSTRRATLDLSDAIGIVLESPARGRTLVAGIRVQRENLLSARTCSVRRAAGTRSARCGC